MDYSPSGFSVHGILQASILEWVAISISRGSSQSRDWTQVSWIAGRHFNPLSPQGSPITWHKNCLSLNSRGLLQWLWTTYFHITSFIPSHSLLVKIHFFSSLLIYIYIYTYIYMRHHVQFQEKLLAHLFNNHIDIYIYLCLPRDH